MDKKILLLIFWFFIFFLIYFHTTDNFNQDLGRHIKLGEIIWQTKFVPKTNLFSYTNPDESVFNSHWGSQVVFYLVHRAAGVNGLIIMSALINATALWIVFTLAIWRVGFLIPSLVIMPFLYIFLDRTWIRPEMFGNLFFAILLVMLYSEKFRNKFIWLVPLIMLLWINFHISWVLGIFTAGVVFLSFPRRRESNYFYRFRVNVQRTGVLPGMTVVVGLSAIAPFLNPYGLDGIINSLNVLNKYGYTIVENQSLFFLKDFATPAGGQGFPLVWHILTGFFVIFLSFFLTFHKRRKFLLGELVLLLVVSILTLRFVRNEIFLGFLGFLIASLNFGQIQSVIPAKAGIYTNGSRVKPGMTIGKEHLGLGISFLLVLITVLLVNQNHQSKGLPLGLGNREVYKPGVDYFIKNDLKGPIFNNFDIGGYLIYRLWPDTKVFVDNRPEAYPVEFFEKIYKPAQEDPKKFDEVVSRYGIQTIIWGYRDITPWSRAFLRQINQNPAWEQKFLDEALVIYTKKS